MTAPELFPHNHVFAGLRRNFYRCILVDAPWRFAAGTKGRPQHYRRMKDFEIAALPIAELAHPEGAWVIAWTISSKTHHAFEICGYGRFNRRGELVFRGWGARYSSRAFVWVKTNKSEIQRQRPLFINPRAIHMGQGFTTRKNAEDALLFKFGRPKRKRKDVLEVIFEPLREHSRKPEESYDRIESFCDGPYVEIFSREDRPGWDVFGDETGKFTIREIAA